jgi:hypothetical protein
MTAETEPAPTAIDTLKAKAEKEMVANLKANNANPARANKSALEHTNSFKVSQFSRPIGEGTHTHHRDKALAHLDAAQAHAQAAHSARVVTAAEGHDAALEAARAAEAATQDEP